MEGLVNRDCPSDVFAASGKGSVLSKSKFVVERENVEVVMTMTLWTNGFSLIQCVSSRHLEWKGGGMTSLSTISMSLYTRIFLVNSSQAGILYPVFVPQSRCALWR